MDMDNLAEDVVITHLSDEVSDEALDITVPIIEDDLRAGQLGTQIYRSLAEHQATPRSLITAASKKDAYYFQVRFHYAQYGTYQGKDACLIVLRLSFQQHGSSRYKSAELEVEFEDAVNVGINPFDNDIDTTYQPRVLAYEPVLFEGPVTGAIGSTSVKLDVPLSVPGGIVGITPGISYTKGSVYEGKFRIHGVVKEDPPSLIHWTMREDKIKKNGIRPELSVPIIVSYTPGRRFAARVRFKADLYMTLLRPVCGMKDDPIFFDPDYMKSALRNGQTAATGHHPTVPGSKVDNLDSIQLRDLTRLTNIGGVFGE